MCGKIKSPPFVGESMNRVRSFVYTDIYIIIVQRLALAMNFHENLSHAFVTLERDVRDGLRKSKTIVACDVRLCLPLLLRAYITC